MVKLNDFSRPLSVFKYFSRQILFSRTFQYSPVYSSTFQACANPVVTGAKYWPAPVVMVSLLICLCLWGGNGNDFPEWWVQTPYPPSRSAHAVSGKTMHFALTEFWLF